jgi:hypothetical protein
MILRTLIALAFCTLPLTHASAAETGDRVDPLYTALLKSNLVNLPDGVTAAHIAPAKVESDDASVGAIENVQITFDGKDPSAKVNYLLFATPDLASVYFKRYDALLTSSGAARKFLPYTPGAECADATKVDAMVCMSAIGRVIVYSYGALQDEDVRSSIGPTSVSGPLMKLAVDHLTSVRAATGTQ